jgi:8-oxo-dGTP diphosphatase
VTNRLNVPIRCAALIDAPESGLRRALLSTAVWTRAAVAVGADIEFAASTNKLRPGDLVRFRGHPFRPLRTLRVVVENGLPTLVSAGSAGRSTVKLGFHTATTGAGSLVTVDFTVDSRIAILNATYRSQLIRYGEMLLGITTLIAREPVRVVAAAVISDGKVLLTRRLVPAGRWELPGGKVEPGESEEEALERELMEELAIRISVSRRIGPVVRIDPDTELVCYRAFATHGDPIRLIDHDAYEWVDADQLVRMDLLDSDRELVESLRNTLQIST